MASPQPSAVVGGSPVSSSLLRSATFWAFVISFTRPWKLQPTNGTRQTWHEPDASRSSPATHAELAIGIIGAASFGFLWMKVTSWHGGFGVMMVLAGSYSTATRPFVAH